MKRKWITIIGLFGFGLLAGQEARAFYSPSTGRWLNRDPKEDISLVRTVMRQTNVLRARWSGGKKVQSLKRGTVDEVGFCANDGMNRVDSLGLEAITTAEQQGYCKDPCKEYADRQRGDNEGWSLDGAAVCCGGKMYLCAWGQANAKNERARELIKECIEKHEAVHRDNNHLASCAFCDWSATKPGYAPGVNPDSAECQAHTEGEACLSAAKVRCNGDSDCEAEVEAARQAKERARDTFCKRVPKPR